MNTDGHGFSGAEKEISPCSFRSRFGGYLSSPRKKPVIALPYPCLSVFIRGSIASFRLGGRRTKFFKGRGVALRHPDGAARRPYPRKCLIQGCSSSPAGAVSVVSFAGDAMRSLASLAVSPYHEIAPHRVHMCPVVPTKLSLRVQNLVFLGTK